MVEEGERVVDGGEFSVPVEELVCALCHSLVGGQDHLATHLRTCLSHAVEEGVVFRLEDDLSPPRTPRSSASAGEGNKDGDGRLCCRDTLLPIVGHLLGREGVTQRGGKVFLWDESSDGGEEGEEVEGLKALGVGVLLLVVGVVGVAGRSIRGSTGGEGRKGGGSKEG